MAARRSLGGLASCGWRQAVASRRLGPSGEGAAAALLARPDPSTAPGRRRRTGPGSGTRPSYTTTRSSSSLAFPVSFEPAVAPPLAVVPAVSDSGLPDERGSPALRCSAVDASCPRAAVPRASPPTRGAGGLTHARRPPHDARPRLPPSRRGSRLLQPRRAAAVPDARAATPAAPLVTSRLTATVQDCFPYDLHSVWLFKYTIWVK